MVSLVGIVFLKHILKSQSLISLQMNNRFTRCLIFMFKIPMDNKEFFHGYKHDYKHFEIWYQQEVGSPQPQSTSG
jgi:hypothetical protein